MDQKDNSCSFCGRTKEETHLLVAGADGVYICDKCIVQANNLVQEELFSDADQKIISEDIALVKPKEIKAILDDYIIGQDDAKKVIAVSVYNHYKRLMSLKDKIEEDEVEIEKSNVILVGPTGTGKTLIAKTVAKMLQVPFSIVDATVFTEAGYVGEDVESILSRLLQSCDYDIAKAEKGIVYIDEVDKIARKQDNASITKDVSGEGVQQGLLKLLEGSEVLVPPEGGRKHPDQKMVKINTKNILFICGGAFDGVEKVIQKRMNSNAVGFKTKKGATVSDLDALQYVISADLKSFGMIPELLGRLPVVTYLNPLDASALRSILTEPKNALMKQYSKLFEYEGVTLSFSDEVFELIVEKALENKLGARGLRGICEAILIDAMFDIPSEDNITELEISLDYAQRKLNKLDFQSLKVA
jgi:ATP-dependent Clp protease ATP-binding subunit ClpX